MKIYDITQELFSSNVYQGDLSPTFIRVADMKKGDNYNLSNLSICAHNGTHIDAPFHFLNNGKTIDKIDLSKCIGECEVVECNGLLNENMLSNLACNRLLIKGEVLIDESVARLLIEKRVALIGVESQTIGDYNKPMAVHKILLEKEVVMLEGLNLKEASVGKYDLIALPLKLGSCDGAPARVVLIEK